MKNLYEETCRKLCDHDKVSDDIIFIGSYDQNYSCTWDEFKILADKSYDNGFGAVEVAENLIIIFGDLSRLERREYDGAEHWAYVPVIKPDGRSGKPIDNLFDGYLGDWY